jgi:hypothetical protein
MRKKFNDFMVFDFVRQKQLYYIICLKSSNNELLVFIWQLKVMFEQSSIILDVADKFLNYKVQVIVVANILLINFFNILKDIWDFLIENVFDWSFIRLWWCLYYFWNLIWHIIDRNLMNNYFLNNLTWLIIVRILYKLLIYLLLLLRVKWI